MKKYILSLILVLSALSMFGKMTQSNYRWRSDNGDESTATWKAPINTPIILTDIGETIRLRLEFHNPDDGLGSSDIDHYIYYSKDGGTSWVQITTDVANDFRMVSSDYVTHGTVTTNLFGTGTGGSFQAGRIISAITPDYSVLLNTGLRTETEWVIQPTINCVNYTTYLFQMQYWEADIVYGELNTNFDCEEPEISFADTNIERCGPGKFEVEGTIDFEDGIIRYWTAAEGGDLLGEGDTFLTASYATNTTIYAEGFGAGCFTDERTPIHLIVRAVPEIHIDTDDGTVCAFNAIYTLNTFPAQPATNTILWSTGATTPSIDLPPTYGVVSTIWVKVTTEYGCEYIDTVRLVINPSPNVNLGDDVRVCEGGMVELDAGNPGESYYWSTGANTQKIIVTSGGNYNVIVTNEYGCMATDSVYVTVSGFSPTVEGITVNNLGPKSFQFAPFHPYHITGYKWDFGDGTSTSASTNPIHHYAEAGTYLVTLEVSSTCGKAIYETYATAVLGINDVEIAEQNLKVFPIPAQHLLNIETLNDIKMERIYIFDMKGSVVMEMPLDKQSQCQIDVDRLPAGLYQLKVATKNGFMIKKFQILK